MGDSALSDLDAVSLLADPVRRRLYDHLAGCARPSGRDELAAAVGVGRSLAAYHLDKLAARGLLEVEYRRPAGRLGPGAGRPAKLYRRAGREFVVRLPPRDYGVLAELLVDIVEAGGGHSGEAARELGRRWGEAAGRAGGDPRRALEELMRSHGYEPFVSTAGELRLRNCPFDAVAARHPDVVCALNLALVEGVLEGLGVSDVRAVLAPAPGSCCVAICR